MGGYNIFLDLLFSIEDIVTTFILVLSKIKTEVLASENIRITYTHYAEGLISPIFKYKNV